MKKVLAYTFAAVLLGVATMLAPFTLFIGEMGANEMDTQAEGVYPYTPEYMRTMSSETEQKYGITPATYSPDYLSIAFMFTLSLVVALGAMSYFKRKTFSSSLP